MDLIKFPISAPGLQVKLQCNLITSEVLILFTQRSKGSISYSLMSELKLLVV